MLVGPLLAFLAGAGTLRIRFLVQQGHPVGVEISLMSLVFVVLFLLAYNDLSIPGVFNSLLLLLAVVAGVGIVWASCLLGRQYPSWPRVFLPPFVGCFLVVFIAGTVLTVAKPESFSSTARIRLSLSPTNASSAWGAPMVSGVFDSRFLQTQCETIQSEAILIKAAVSSGFIRHRANSGDYHQTPERVTTLKRSLELRNVAHTSLIEVRCVNDAPDMAARVANGVVEAYRDYCQDAGSAKPDSSAIRVEIIDRAQPGLRPVRPNKPLTLLLAMLAGLGLGCPGWRRRGLGRDTQRRETGCTRRLRKLANKADTQAGAPWMTSVLGGKARRRRMASRVALGFQYC